MSKNLFVLVAAVILIAAVGAAAWYAYTRFYPNTNGNTNDPYANVTVTPSNNAISASAAPEACSVLTAAQIKTQLGFEVGAGSATSSYLQGTTCAFTSTDGNNSIVVVQTSSNPAMYYVPDVYKPNTKYTDVGEQAFVQTPTAGVSHAAVVKDGKMVLVSISASKATFTTDAVKALLTNAAQAF